MAAHSGILTWEIPRTEEPAGLQSMGLQRDGHNRAYTQRMSEGEDITFSPFHLMKFLFLWPSKMEQF